MTSWQIRSAHRRYLHPAVARARHSGQPDLREPLVARLHGLRRRQPVAKRADQVVPDGNHRAQARCPSGLLTDRIMHLAFPACGTTNRVAEERLQGNPQCGSCRAPRACCSAGNVGQAARGTTGRMMRNVALLLSTLLTLAAQTGSATDLLDVWRAAQQHDLEFAAAGAAHQAGEARRTQAGTLWRPSVQLTGTAGRMSSETSINGAQFSAPGFGQTNGVNFNTSVTNGAMGRWSIEARQPLLSRERQAQGRQLELSADVADLEWQNAQQTLDADHRAALFRRRTRERIAARAAAAAERSRSCAHRDEGSSCGGRHTGHRHLRGGGTCRGHQGANTGD